MKTNRILLISGVLAAFTAAVHTFMGTPEIQRPLLESALAQPISLMLYACWHLVTVTLVLSALALVWSARPRNRTSAGALPLFVSLLWLLFGSVFVVVALAFVGPSALLVLPQWVLLVPVGVLGWLGSRRQFVSPV
ncbi:hypothetical protein ACUHMQ_19250 [Chitinimonas sp. PSY-7]|uniref:hypothetical protein n=1 Tax=Chitinimonas sp. PSY-7 TaxID=3459088 RepID=UPI004040081B